MDVEQEAPVCEADVKNRQQGGDRNTEKTILCIHKACGVLGSTLAMGRDSLPS